MRRLVSAALVVLCAAAAAAAPSIPEILPASSFIVAGTPNLTALREGFQRTPFWRLWEEPEIQAFLKPLVDKVNERLQSGAQPPLLTAQEFFDLFPAQVYGGIIRISDVDGHPDVGLFFAAETSHPERVTDLVDKLIERSGAEQTRDTYTVRDVTISRNALRWAEPASLPGAPTQAQALPEVSTERTVTLHTAVFDGLVFLTIDEPLEGVINNLRGGGGESLAQSASLRSTSALSGNPDYQLLLHINPAPFAAALAQGVPPSQNFNITALGLGDFQGLSDFTQFGPEATQSWLALSVGPNPVGLGRLLSHGGTGEFPALAWVPGNVATLSALHYDMGAAWGTLRQLVQSVSPTFNNTLNSLLQTANQSLGFDIEGDLMTVLGSEIVSHGEIPESGSPTNAIILGLRDPAKVQGVLARLAQPPVVGAAQVSGGSGMLEAKEYLGQTYYSPPSVFAQQSPGAAPQPAFAVIGDHLVFASAVSEMQRIIAANQGQMETPVTRSSLWERIQAHQVPRASGFGYQDDAQVMAASVQELQQMALFFMMMPGMSIPLDFTHVPSKEVFERSLTHTVTSTRIEDSGLLIYSTSPNRE
jgi:hypothetical protein